MASNRVNYKFMRVTVEAANTWTRLSEDDILSPDFLVQASNSNVGAIQLSNSEQVGYIELPAGQSFSGGDFFRFSSERNTNVADFYIRSSNDGDSVNVNFVEVL